MERNNYVNYYQKSISTIKHLKGDKKPSFLLHSCCGPCSTFPLKFLAPYFDITIMYNNSNIYPTTEYERRLNELKKYLEFFKRDFGYDVKLIITPYNHIDYMEPLKIYADQKEGLERCFLCYEKRMDEAFKYANDNHFDFFCTVMTISRQKDSQILNQIGAKLQSKYDYTKYFFSDYQKKKGIDYGKELAEKYNLYKQEYCGCEYSMRRLEKKNNE